MQFRWADIISFNIKCLRFVSILPRDRYGFNLYALYTACTMTCMGLFVVLGAVKLSQPGFFNEVMNLLFILFSMLVCYVKMVIFVLNSSRIQRLLKALDAELFRPMPSQLVLIQNDFSLWQKLYNFLFGTACSTTVVWLSLPVVTGGWRKSLPAPIWCVWGCATILEYSIMYGFVSLCAGICVIAAYNLDMFFAAIMVFIGAQCEILNQNLRQLNAHPDVFPDELMFCIRHYRAILHFVQEFNSFSNLSFFVQFFLSLVNVAITLFQAALSKPGDFEFYNNLAIVVVLITQIFSYCFFGNKVLSKLMKRVWSYFMLLQQLNSVN